MKFPSRKVEDVLPIVLAVVLPGIGMYNNADLYELNAQQAVRGWLTAALLFYFIWQIYWRIGGIKRLNQRYTLMVLVALANLSIPFIATAFGKVFPETPIIASFRILMGLILLLSVQFALRSQRNIVQLELEKEQLQTENYRVQLKALQNKVDPHFLFNSMNTLLAMVRKGSDKSEQFVLSLSDFYRQTLKHNNNLTIALADEMEVLQSYLFLMKSRNEHAVEISLEVDDQVRVYHLPTMSMQMVLENCFKHNAMTTKRPLKISISNQAGFIQVSNNKQPKLGEMDKSGLGLGLLKRRYALLGEQDGVEILDSEETFTVRLKLLEA